MQSKTARAEEKRQAIRVELEENKRAYVAGEISTAEARWIDYFWRSRLIRVKD